MARPDRYFVGIDIGSSKVGVLIGQRAEENGPLEVVGKGLAPNRGTRRGNIVNVDQTVVALKQAAEEAEIMAGVEIERAYVGVAGVDVRSVNSRGMVSVTRKDREIGEPDIRRVLDAAQSAALPSDREILHAIPQEFLVDDQGGIAEPLGMVGSRLEAAVHLVTAHATRGQTLVTCVNRAGIRVTEMVFEPLAAAEAVLFPDERDLGVLLVDIGSGTTGYGLFQEGEVHHSGVVPIGAGHFTSDLAQMLRTPFEEAEKIKIKSGCCLAHLVGDEEGISVPPVGGGSPHVVRRRELTQILQPRAEELFEMVRDDLHRVGCDGPPRGGVVLTGGGAQLNGLLEMAEQIFNTRVRYGLPAGFGGLIEVINSPAWTTAAGLLGYALKAEQALGRRRRKGWSMREVVGNLRGMFSDLL
jgi:cell division protein FtsA